MCMDSRARKTPVKITSYGAIINPLLHIHLVMSHSLPLDILVFYRYSRSALIDPALCKSARTEIRTKGFT